MQQSCRMCVADYLGVDWILTYTSTAPPVTAPRYVRAGPRRWTLVA